jgi:thiol-disulfide isomerase/thioredoxin
MKIKVGPKLLLVAVTVLVLAGAVSAQSTLKTGSTIPQSDRSMKAVSGGDVTIASVKGSNGTVVAFWCNTCPWVQRWESRFVEIANEYKDKGFGFIAVNSNDPVAYPGDNFDEMKAQASASGYSFPYVVDAGSELAVAFGAKRTPQIFLFDKDNKLVYQGAIDDSPADAEKVQAPYLADALDAVESGGEIASAETKAFGCTIKFQ